MEDSLDYRKAEGHEESPRCPPEDSHLARAKEEEMNKYDDKMDKEVLELCDAMNRLPGVTTTSSCCGHGNSPYAIFFEAEFQEDVAPVSYFVDACHTGHKGWQVIVRADCAMIYRSFLLEGPVGAFAESEDIAIHINEFVDGLIKEEEE